MLDLIAERPELFLGSRLKRLAERMQGEVVKLAERAGLSIQPSQYPLLATLDVQGPQTIGALVTSLGISQPAVTRTVAKLVSMDLVKVKRLGRDQRHKTVALTPAGEAAMTRSKLMVWPQVEAAVCDLLTGLPGKFLPDLGAIEARLTEQPLATRVPSTRGLIIRDYDDALAADFRAINLEWIEAMYTVEATDLDVLDHPRERIIDRGGAILFAEVPGVGIVGTCALQRTGEHQYELTKMGVLPAARGTGAGGVLLDAVIDRASKMGAERLYLLSNRKSAAGIHLYEKHGFIHDEEIMAEFGARYARCDVAMSWREGAIARTGWSRPSSAMTQR